MLGCGIVCGTVNASTIARGLLQHGRVAVEWATRVKALHLYDVWESY